MQNIFDLLSSSTKSFKDDVERFCIEWSKHEPKGLEDKVVQGIDELKIYLTRVENDFIRNFSISQLNLLVENLYKKDRDEKLKLIDNLINIYDNHKLYEYLNENE